MIVPGNVRPPGTFVTSHQTYNCPRSLVTIFLLLDSTYLHVLSSESPSQKPITCQVKSIPLSTQATVTFAYPHFVRQQKKINFFFHWRQLHPLLSIPLQYRLLLRDLSAIGAPQRLQQDLSPTFCLSVWRHRRISNSMPPNRPSLSATTTCIACLTEVIEEFKTSPPY